MKIESSEMSATKPIRVPEYVCATVEPAAHNAGTAQKRGQYNMDDVDEECVRHSEAQEERKRLSEALRGWWKLARPFKAWNLYGKLRATSDRTPESGVEPRGPTRTTCEGRLEGKSATLTVRGRRRTEATSM